jgi:transposase
MKLSIHSQAQIYIYTLSIDMRKSIDGLTVLLADMYQQNPMQGDLFVFTNKQRDKVKILVWDKNGFVLYYKRLEKGKFNYSKHIQGNKIIITTQQLQALLMGLDFYLLGEYSLDFVQNYF